MVRCKLLYFVLLLLSLSLVAAVNVSTDKTEYNSGEIVTANVGDCVGTSITKFLNPSGNLVDIKSGEGNWSTSYHASSDLTKGKYTVSASCSNGLAQENFCVDASGCLEEVVCEPAFECGEWSSCGLDNLERRTCTDKNNCEAPEEETRPCTVCQESWTCFSWSECQNGIQTRTCYDQNSCGTTVEKPAAQQACEEFEPYVPPAEPVKEGTFFQKYGAWIIGVAVVIVLAVLAFLALRFFKPKDLTELTDWIEKERGKGLSDEEIRSRVAEAGWMEKDVKAAFKKLK